MLGLLLAVAIGLSAAHNGVDVTVGVAGGAGLYDPLGIVKASTPLSKQVSIVASHTSSIPSMADNRADGGLNTIGLEYTTHIRGLDK